MELVQLELELGRDRVDEEELAKESEGESERERERGREEEMWKGRERVQLWQAEREVVEANVEQKVDEGQSRREPRVETGESQEPLKLVQAVDVVEVVDVDEVVLDQDGEGQGSKQEGNKDGKQEEDEPANDAAK